MNRIIIGVLIMIIPVACSPSEAAIQTAMAETEAAKPTETSTPTITPIPTLTPTLTPTVTPTNTPKPTPTEISCDRDQLIAYLKSLVPVTEKMSEKIHFLSENPSVLVSMNLALIQQIEIYIIWADALELEPPPCAQPGHDKVLESIQITLDALDLVISGDFDGATKKLDEFQPIIDEAIRLIQEAVTMLN